MKFPGRRKSKHYFPVSARDPHLSGAGQSYDTAGTHIVGIDQTIVDIEAYVTDEFIEGYGLSKGHSLLIDDATAERLYDDLKRQDLVSNEHAGGTIGNTLHNYSVLADDRSVLLGVMSQDIKIGSYGYRYICNTSSRVDLNYLQAVDGAIGRCFTLISQDGERTFAINAGKFNYLEAASVPEEVFEGASALVITSYLLRCLDSEPIKDAAMKAVQFAKARNIPVVLTLGTKFVIQDDPEFWQQFISEHVTIVAMNEEEAEALTGLSDPLLAADRTLEWVDMVLCTAGSQGLFMAGYSEKGLLKETENPLLPGAIAEYNRFEYSRAMLRADCKDPIKVYSHIAPYMGGPVDIKNTNGAGDAALSAVLHDIAANSYHKMSVPNSSKHTHNFLSYSSFSQMCKYANRTSYVVLSQHSPRMSRGLPEREDSLEEGYWR